MNVIITGILKDNNTGTGVLSLFSWREKIYTRNIHPFWGTFQQRLK